MEERKTPEGRAAKMQMTEREPEVSVIMPAYNAQTYLGLAVQSVQDQTFQDWELIIVDDASTDQTKSIIEKFCEEDRRIRGVFQPYNQGVSAARNLAISMSRGRYVAFLDSDDLWRANKLERQLKLARDTKADVLYSSYGLIDQNGVPGARPFVVKPKVRYKDMLVRNEIGCLTAMVRRDVLLKHPFSGKVYHEDYALWLELLQAGYAMRGDPEVLADYRVMKNTRSANKRKSAEKRWRVYRDVAQLSLPQSARYFVQYALNGAIKYSAQTKHANRKWKTER